MLLFVTTFIQKTCISLASSNGPLLSIKPFT